MKILFPLFTNKLQSISRLSSLLFAILFCIPTLLLIISTITYFYIIDSSNSSDSDTNMLCDMSYVYGFDADLDLDELTDFLYFFM
jgi:hypothetical protein